MSAEPLTDSRSRALFADLVARPDEAIDLAQAALLIACEEYPALDVSGYLARLEQMGEALRERLGADPILEAVVAGLNAFLFDEQGFRGNPRDYYDPRNSFLNDVLDRRTGIPISLSTVYIEVARHAGVRATGVGLPGHFIVKVESPEGELLVDPYHRGAVLAEADCQKRLDRIYGGKLKLSPEMLSACGAREMLARMLRNLKAIYGKRGDHQRALGIVQLLISLLPDAHEELRDRGLLWAARDCYGWAARDLEAYLGREPKPQPAVAGAVRAKIEEMRWRASRLH